MTSINARLALAGGPHVVNLAHLVGQEVDLWDCGAEAVPVGVVVVTGASVAGDGSALLLTLSLRRAVAAGSEPAWVTAGDVVDVSTRYEWLAPGLLRLHALAHTSPCRLAGEVAA